MILLDTSVIVEYWRKPTRDMEEALSRLNPCICGVVLAELLQGARTEFDVVRTERALAGFHSVSIPEVVWRSLGLNQSALRKVGLKVPFQDVLLATVAIERGLELWTLDKHYSLIQPVLKGLRLFSLE